MKYNSKYNVVTFLLLLLATLTLNAQTGPGGVTSGLSLWLKANEGTTTSGASVTAWQDFSINGNNAIAGSAKPALVNGSATSFNFNKYINFDVTKSLYNITDNIIGGVNAFDIITVTNKITSPADNRKVFSLFSGNTSANKTHILGLRSNAVTYINNPNAVPAYSHNAQIGDPFKADIPSITFNRFGNTALEKGINGKEFSAPIAAAPNGKGAFNGGYAVGARFGILGLNDFAFQGHIGEVIVYNRNITSQEKLRIDSYLALKYGVTLEAGTASNYVSSNGTTIWDATTNAAYYNDITGIGRDDDSALNQKQSTSINTNDIVTIGLGAIEATNEANVATFATDKSFLLWGNNGSDPTLTQNISGGISGATGTLRLTKEWKVAQSGNVSNLEISFNNVPAAAAGALSVELYVDATGTGDFSNATITSGTIINGKPTFTGVSLSNNAVFTLGFVMPAPAITFAPGGVAGGLSLWLKADVDAPNVTGTAGVWKDQSGNNSDASGRSSSKGITTGELVNFNPTVSFAGVNVYEAYEIDNPFISAGDNSMAAFSVGTGDGGTWLAAGYNGTTNDGLTINNSAPWSSFHFTQKFFSLANTKTKTRLMSVSYNASNQTRSMSMNSSVPDLNATSSLNFNPSNAIVGAPFAGTYARYNGNIPEVIVYKDNALTPEQTQRIESYLAIKYGVSIDQTTPTNYLASDASVIWDKTINAGYNKDIAGIGRDDASVLTQKQSKSANEVDLVTIGLTTIANTNTDNATAITNDKNFLIWGNNGADAKALQASQMPPSAAAKLRLSRAWKVAETGTIDNLHITFDNISAGATDLELYVDTDGDGDFSNATIITGGVVVNGKASFTGVNLNDGDVFTLGMTVFSPGGVSGGLSLWLRADIDAPIAGASGIWKDQSGGNRDATGKSASLGATGDLMNFNPSVAFTGKSNEYYNFDLNNLEGLFLRGDNSNAAFSVGDGLGGAWLSAGYQLPAKAAVSFFNSADSYGYGYEFYRGTRFNKSLSYDKARIMSAHYTATTKEKSISINGGVSETVTQGQLNYVPRNGYIGRYFNGVKLYNGNLPEVIVFKDNITEQERQRVESYLAIKYGITIDQTTPTNYIASNGAVIWDATTNATYNNEITGIGRDDVSVLTQKQSKSASKEDPVTIGLGTIATTNVANTNTFTNDTDFLVWGNNGADAKAFQATQMPPTADAKVRLARAWKVDKTGTVDNLNITFDNVPSNAFDLELYVDTDGDGDFTNATVITGGVVVNGKASFTGVNLNDGDVFTFGRTVFAPGGVSGGLSLWLKANVDAPAAGLGGIWKDQSGGDRDATGKAASLGVTGDLINYNPSISFTGAADEIYEIAKTDVFSEGNNDNAAFSIGTGKGGSSLAAGTASTGEFVYLRNVTPKPTFDALSSTTTITEKARMMSTQYTASPATRKMFINSTFSGTKSGSALSFIEDKVIIGSHLNGTSLKYEGNIPEVITYKDNALTEAQRLRVETYLAIKYGVGIDQTTPTNYLASNGSVIWDATANVGYVTEIAGIGRDDVSVLTQKQSRSTSGDDILAIGLGSIATTNAANTNTFANDTNFLIWGNNGIAASKFQSTEKPTTAASSMRLSRAWKVAETGTINNLNLTFDNVSAAASNIELYVDTDGDGDFTNATVITGTVVNGKASFTGVDLNDGDVFTLGITLPGPGGVTSGLSLWLRADIDGPAVGVGGIWKDQSTASINAVGKSGALGATGDLMNFNPSVAFDGTGNGAYLMGSYKVLSNGNNDMAAFSVGSGIGGFWFNGGLRTRYNRIVSISNKSSNPLFSIAGSYFFKPYVNEGSRIMSANYTASNTTRKISMNSDAAITQTSGSFNYLTDERSNLSHLNIGYSSARSDFKYEGNLPEVIVYKDNALTEEETQRVETYLAIKYGITLDQTTPTNYLASDGSVIWDATTNATYNNEITGIGRDDASVLTQKQSKSASKEDVVTIGLGIIATTNTANTTSFTNDKSFLVWGNNNLDVNKMKATDKPVGAAAKLRLEREWKVAKIGAVDNLHITFDNVSPNAFDLELYVDSDGDGDFSNATVITGGVVVDGKASFTGVTLNDGDVFTLGMSLLGPGGVTTNLSLWLRADKDAPAAGVGGVWKDQSSHGRNAIGSTDAQGATGKLINFNPTVKFPGTGTSEKYEISDLDILSGYYDKNNGDNSLAAFSVGDGLGGAWLSVGKASRGRAITLKNTVPKPAFDFYAIPFAGTKVVTEKPRLMNAYYDADVRTRSLYINNEFSGSQSTYSLSIIKSVAVIGNSVRGISKYVGDLPEVILYKDDDLTAEQRLRINTYLAIKYGITLNQTTPTNYVTSDGSVIWDASINAGYNKAIAGIGRDDASILIQKQSTATSEEDLVTIGLGTIATSNVANTNTFTNDTNFLVWGHNGIDAGIFQSTEMPTGANAKGRLGRAWKVDETGGDINNLNITFNSISRSATDLELYVDTDGDGDFTNATVITGGVVVNGKASFTGVDLNDGDVFTLGLTISAPGGVANGLNLWLRADKGAVVSSDEVTTWEDQAKYFNATALETRYQADFTENSRNFNPGLTFDTSGNFYNLPAGIVNNGNTNYAMISVVSKSRATRGSILSFGKSSAPTTKKIISYEIDGIGKLTSTWARSGDYFSTGNVALNTPVVYTATYDNTIGRAMRKDGLVVGTNASTELNYVQEASVNAIGTYNAYTSRYHAFLGDMNEIIVYSTTTTTAVELQRIESYLALKYGITLDQTTAKDYLASDATVIWDATTNAIYSNDIAGIGKDESSDLLQKQSKSENNDALVTIGLGEVATTNILNSNTFGADKNFLLWGNDNAVTTVVNTGIPGIFSEKIARNWMIQETGTVESTLVQIPDSIVANFTNQEGISLFVADDADFTTNIVQIPLVKNGTNWEANFNFDGTKYFSFGILGSSDFMRHGKYFQGGKEKKMKF